MGSDIALRLMNPAEATELVKSGDVLARTFVAIFAGAGSTDRRRSRFRKLIRFAAPLGATQFVAA